jgi:hypothetical protein
MIRRIVAAVEQVVCVLASDDGVWVWVFDDNYYFPFIIKHTAIPTATATPTPTPILIRFATPIATEVQIWHGDGNGVFRNDGEKVWDKCDWFLYTMHNNEKNKKI